MEQEGGGRVGAQQVGTLMREQANMRVHFSIVVLSVSVTAWLAASVQAQPAASPAPTFQCQGLLERAGIQKGLANALVTAKNADRRPETQAAAYNMAGVYSLFLGNYKEAKDNLDLAIQKDPKTAAYYANRGMVHRIAGEWIEAEKDYEAAQKLSSGDPFIENNLGWLKLLEAMKEQAAGRDPAGKFDAAKTCFEKAEKPGTSPQCYMASVNLAIVKLLRGYLCPSHVVRWTCRGSAGFMTANTCSEHDRHLRMPRCGPRREGLAIDNWRAPGDRTWRAVVIDNGRVRVAERFELL